MSYALFIDDERQPNLQIELQVRVTRTVRETIWILETLGPPRIISFDHDLGLDGSEVTDAMSVLKWIVEAHLDLQFDAKRIEQVIIHSHNPEGAKNLASLWQSFAKHIGSAVPAIRRPYDPADICSRRD